MPVAINPYSFICYKISKRLSEVLLAGMTMFNSPRNDRFDLTDACSKRPL